MNERNLKDLTELQGEYGTRIPYHELLSSKEWWDKRTQVVDRDRRTCRKCNQIRIDDWRPRAFGPYTVMWPVQFKVTEVMVKKYIPTIDAEVEMPEFVCDEEYVHKLIPRQIKLPTGELKTVYDEDASEALFLHVHHTYYDLAKLPWEYPDESLITVCSSCHKKIHETEKIPVYKNEQELNLTKCKRCNGQGILKEYWYWQNGVCFDCGGQKYTELIRPWDKIYFNK
jgi:hypothetical protein